MKGTTTMWMESSLAVDLSSWNLFSESPRATENKINSIPLKKQQNV